MPFVTFTPYCNCLPLCLCHQPPLRDLFPHSNTSRLTFVTPWAKSVALMYVHLDKNMDIEQLIDLFAQMHPRRIRMANILHDDGV